MELARKRYPIRSLLSVATAASLAACTNRDVPANELAERAADDPIAVAAPAAIATPRLLANGRPAPGNLIGKSGDKPPPDSGTDAAETSPSAR